MDVVPTTTAPSRGPRSDATANRQAILDAAAAALNADPDASIDTIAAAAGLSRRAVYGHFASRDQLLTAVWTVGAARIGASILGLSHPDARVQIALYGATLWSQIEHTRVMAQLALRGDQRDQVTAALQPARTALRHTVERGVTEGTLRSDIAASILAELIEAAAIAVLDLSMRTDLGEGAAALVMLNGLSAAGVDWRTADELIRTTPELSAAVNGR